MRIRTVVYFCCIVISLPTLISCSKPNNSNQNPSPKQITHSEFVPPGYTIRFNDEFESLDLDLDGDGSSTWAPWWVDWNVRFLEGNDDKAWKCDESYKGSGQTSLDVVLHEITKDQTLRLYGKQTPKDKLNIVYQKPFIGGMISANNSYSQTYGYWEIKCKFDVSQGHHWAVWLLPADNSWPPEIDIVEVGGQWTKMPNSTTVWPTVCEIDYIRIYTK